MTIKMGAVSGADWTGASGFRGLALPVVAARITVASWICSRNLKTGGFRYRIPGPADGFVDGFQNCLGHERLLDERETRWDPIVVTGNQYYWESRERAPDRVCQIDSVHVPRHPNIGNQQIDLAAKSLYDSERLDGILGFQALNPPALQNGAEVCANGGFVVNDKTDAVIHRLHRPEPWCMSFNPALQRAAS
jgi:hypothetical protein